MTLISFSFTCRTASASLLTICLLILATQVWELPRRLKSNQFSLWPAEVVCPPVAGFDDILVILKTGATEALEKVPVHLSTTLRCVPHHTIYSDLEEDIAGHHVLDVLEDVDGDFKSNNKDFDFYNRLQTHGRDGFRASELNQWASTRNLIENPAHRLDKWKFMPLVESAFRFRPETKWYVFVEADTYLIWSSLLERLSKIDPTKPFYIGNQMRMDDVVYAHGGSGFVLSNSAIQMVSEKRENQVDYYNDYTASQSAGDCILGKIAKDAGVPVTSWSGSNFQSGQPSELSLETKDYDRSIRCNQAVSYHHLLSDEIAAFWDFEQDWNRQNKSLLRHKDVIEHFMLTRLKAEHEDWDNLSDVPASVQDDRDGVESFEECRDACEKDNGCFQFSYSDSSCLTSSVVRLGHKVNSRDDGTIRAGWMIDRIKTFMRSMEPCRDESHVLA